MISTILSVSYDRTLLTTRQQLLESEGYRVISAAAFSECLELCHSTTPFGLFIVGHSIPIPEREALMEAFRSNRPTTPIIALKRAWEQTVGGADVSIEPRPDELLLSVARLLSGEGATA